MSKDGLLQTVEFVEQGFEAGWYAAIAAVMTIMEREKMSPSIMKEIYGMPVNQPPLLARMKARLE